MKSIVKISVPKGYRLLRKNEIVRKTDRRICAQFEPNGSDKLFNTVSPKSLLRVFVGEKPGINSFTGHPRLFIRKVKNV
jgi:hypothetical protein